MKTHFALTVLASMALWAALVVGCRHYAPNGTRTCTYVPVDDGGVVFSVDCNK